MLPIYTNHPGGNLCIDINLSTIFTKTITCLVYDPKIAINVVFDFSWDDCIERRKQNGNNGNENLKLKLPKWNDTKHLIFQTRNVSFSRI